MSISRFACIVTLLGAGILAGCGETGTGIELRYDRPAAVEISPSVKRIAVAEFVGKTPKDRAYGDIASDATIGKLDENNRKFQRFVLVDRKNLQHLLNEQDLQIMSSDQATKAGKIANVDAIIYGNVSVRTETQHGTKQSFDPLSQKMVNVPYTRRYCIATVSFTMDDVKSTKTIISRPETREFDSDKENKSFLSAMGWGGGELPPEDQIANKLVQQCVDSFIKQISPHTVTVKERLLTGKSKSVDSGNKLAMAGEYQEALECYQKGIEACPDDANAIFDAGLMYEAQGTLKVAEVYYDKAFKLREDAKFLAARQRVRGEQKAGPVVPGKEN